MKFKEYLEELNELAKADPRVLDFDVVYASDDEGNSFHLAYTTGTIGIWEDDEFSANEDDDELYQNAICIN